MQTILIVDGDLGLALWLGHILNAGGAAAIPATNIAEAAEMVSRLGLRVDVLIASPGENGMGGFIEKLRIKSPDLQVVALGDEDDLAWVMPSFGTVWRRRPCCGDETTRAEWMGLIHELDHNHLSFASQA